MISYSFQLKLKTYFTISAAFNASRNGEKAIPSYTSKEIGMKPKPYQHDLGMSINHVRTPEIRNRRIITGMENDIMWGTRILKDKETEK